MAARFQATTSQIARPNERGARVQRVEGALQPGRDAFVLLVMDLGQAPKAEQEQVLALDIREHESP